MALATCELMWLKQLLQELKLYESEPMEFICDDQATLHIALNPIFHESTKHIELDCHFIQENITLNEINTIFVNSHD